jgi:hypothetical protein
MVERIIFAAMKSFFLFLIFCCLATMSFAQDWVTVTNPDTDVQVSMPKVPKLEKEQVFTADGMVERTTFSTVYEKVTMVFQAETLPGSNKSSGKNAIQRMIENTTIFLKGSNPKSIRMKKDGIQYAYVEAPLITGEMMRSQVFVYENYVYQVYVKGVITDVFGDNANLFLNSWSMNQILKEITNAIESEDTTSAVSVPFVSALDWNVYTIEPALQVALPGNPVKKTTVVENGLNDIVVNAISYVNPEYRINYSVTIRPFTIDQGQLTNSTIYGYYLERIRVNKKLKLVNHAEIDFPEEGREYVFSKGIQFYRLKLIRANDVMYQFCIKGKRKSIFNEESEHFFNNISISN